jgi:hypothetical protein
MALDGKLFEECFGKKSRLYGKKIVDSVFIAYFFGNLSVMVDVKTMEVDHIMYIRGTKIPSRSVHACGTRLKCYDDVFMCEKCKEVVDFGD